MITDTESDTSDYNERTKRTAFSFNIHEYAR